MKNLNRHFDFAQIMTLVVMLGMLLGNICAAEEMKPVSYTAYTSLYWLKEAGVPEAQEFSHIIGDAKVDLNKNDIPNYDGLQLVNKLYHEMRYAALNEYAYNHGEINIVDIACGFAPRSAAAARHGQNFLGLDFGPVVKDIREILPECLSAKQLKQVSYEAADAKDTAELLKAADKFPGRVCITMDGLMMYLNRDEQAAVLQNIREILQKHGGVYVTSDFSARDFVKASSKVVYGDSSEEQRIYRESAEVYEKVAVADFDTAFFPDDESAIAFIEAQGLKVEKAPLFEQPVTLYSAKELNLEQYQRLQNLEQEKFLWVITVK